MRAAMHSWSFRNHFREDPTFTIEKALDITADLGFTGIEIMCGKANCGNDNFTSDDPDYLKGVLDYAAKKGIDVLSMATYNDFAYTPDEDWRLANIEFIKHWLPLTGKLGVPNIRMLTGYYQEGGDKKELEAMTLAGIKECIPYAEEAGVNMAIENHNSIFFEADDLLNLIEECGSDRMTTCPDPSNWKAKVFFSDEVTEEDREHVFTSAAKLATKATQSHLKIKGVENGKLLGWGDDIDRLIGSYHDAGYDGALAFESIADGDLLEPLAEAREIVESAIQRVCA